MPRSVPRARAAVGRRSWPGSVMSALVRRSRWPAGLLGFGGPKRLVLTLLAMASVSEATIGDVASLSLVAVYVVVATVLVSGVARRRLRRRGHGPRLGSG